MAMAALKGLWSLSQYDRDEDRFMARILLNLSLIYWLANLLVLGVNWIWQDKLLAAALILGCLLQMIPLTFLLRGKLNASSFLFAGLS